MPISSPICLVIRPVEAGAAASAVEGSTIDRVTVTVVVVVVPLVADPAEQPASKTAAAVRTGPCRQVR
ncbi:hypothetical protein EIY87_28755 [Amycolatopsis eburnea]|uniref:Uncharacterized protein n=1 Tax=Amycolatopsis eburnea TaxID=2267691 RepID=A0A3R9KI23_9PSEU|nr:hypothetical protein EIY87_28755 [Amycolatopsis eburnea]